MYSQIPTDPPPARPTDLSGPYSPIDTFQAAFTHLQNHAQGHALVAVTWLAYIFGFMCLGMGFGFGGAMLGASQREPALMILSFYGSIGLVGVLTAPITSAFYYGYQGATLAEISGGEPVSVGGVFRLGFGQIGTILLFTLVNCGLGIAGLMLCYFGIFFTMIPFRYAFLVASDRGLPVSEALALTWSTFKERWKDHLFAFLAAMVVSLVCSAIPIIGAALSFPLIVTFDAFTFRQFYPKNAQVTAA